MNNEALYVQPGGHIEDFPLTGDREQLRDAIAAELDGPAVTWQLGRHMSVHAHPRARHRPRNHVALSTWHDLAGASGPDLRGPVIITGAPDRDRLPQPLPAATAELVAHWARLHRARAVDAGPQVSAVQAIGTRRRQCDAYAVRRDRASGRWAFVVLDGIGDEEEVRAHVGRWAPALAREAALSGDPVDAIAQTRARILKRTRQRRWHYSDPSAVAVVAVHHPEEPMLRLAWSGDARAYRLSHVTGLHLLTKDHNYAQELLDAGRTPGKWDHNSVTANLEDGEIGSSQVEKDVVGQLILCSDGVYHPLETHEPGLLEMAAEIALDAKDSAASLVAEALAVGRRRDEERDNATALVVAFPRVGA